MGESSEILCAGYRRSTAVTETSVLCRWLSTSGRKEFVTTSADCQAGSLPVSACSFLILPGPVIHLAGVSKLLKNCLLHRLRSNLVKAACHSQLL